MNNSQLPRALSMSSDPLAILAERAGTPDRRIHRQAGKPAEQQVVIPLLDRSPFRPDNITIADTALTIKAIALQSY